MNVYGSALNCRSAGKIAKVSNDRFAHVPWASASPSFVSSLKEQSRPEQLLLSTQPDSCLLAGPQSESARPEVWTTALPCICQVVQHQIFDATDQIYSETTDFRTATKASWRQGLGRRSRRRASPELTHLELKIPVEHHLERRPFGQDQIRTPGKQNGS